MRKLRQRLGWWLYCDPQYRFVFVLDPVLRCGHENWLGLQCFRERVYDGYCGLHNYLEYHEAPRRHGNGKRK